MAISKDKALCFRKGGTTYTYYGYTTPPSGHYIGFRSGGVTRYVPLANNTNGELKVRIAGSTYSVTRQISTVRLQVELYNRYAFGVGGIIASGNVRILANTGSLSNAFPQNITVAVYGKLNTSEYSRSITVNAGNSSFSDQGGIYPATQGGAYSTQCWMIVTAFGQTFRSNTVSHSGGSAGSYRTVILSVNVTV